MAVGIKYAPNETGVEKRAGAYAAARTVYKHFEENRGTCLCRYLIKYDLSNPEEAARAREEEAFEEVCRTFVRSAIESFLD